ncbi:S8 family serine peptidase [Parahaliea mediterranea]|uniref:S8 family serine peptidase n=1 Tax=Parahaliea mediterranea TaxID=651086 RepID=UPI001F4E0501|nr:S8 family serine peptidase [Parahaliea mediterranea]
MLKRALLRLRHTGALSLMVGALVLAGPAPVGANTPCCFIGDDEIEEEVTDQVEEEVTDQVEEETEEDVEGDIEEEVEEEVANQVEGTVEETIEGNIEQEIEANIEDDVQASVEESIETGVEESIESGVESAVEDNVEQVVESAVEDSVESSVEVAVEDSVEDGVEAGVEAGIEDTIENTVENTVESTVEVAVESQVESQVEESVETSVESNVEAAVATTIEDRLESEIDEILDEIENKLEVNEDRIQTAQWLVMAEPEAFDELAEKGYLFDNVTELPGMGLRLAEVAAPSTFEISEVRQGVVDVVGSERADVDLNHFYTAGSPIEHSIEGIAPRTAVPFPADVDELGLRIGMIDSQVDTSHPALVHSSIQSQSFVRQNARTPAFHGTAIASIIAANSDDYQGLAPHAKLFAAGVFEQDGERGEVASTVSLVRALDWLVTAGVDVVNVSLAGPPNRLLETALDRASERGVLILAAAGNGGPVAKPKYPAAYPSVVAVTAVDTAGRAFRLANRGDYLDIAAPGVGMLHARAGGGYATSSGTSFAVPFATTAAARLRFLQPGTNVLESLYRSVQDLGAPGRDEVYGYGLLQPLALVTSGR